MVINDVFILKYKIQSNRRDIINKDLIKNTWSYIRIVMYTFISRGSSETVRHVKKKVADEKKKTETIRTHKEGKNGRIFLYSLPKR